MPSNYKSIRSRNDDDDDGDDGDDHQRNIDRNDHDDDDEEASKLLLTIQTDSLGDVDSPAVMSPQTSIAFQELMVPGTKLGEGGFCVVHEANWKGRSCALKFLRPDLSSEALLRQGRKDLETEAKLLQELNHPHIIQLYGTGNFDQEGGPYLVLERLDKTLDEILSNATTEGAAATSFMLLERLTLALQVAQALQYVHQRNILYRDLKPSNIALDEHGRARLFDFGLAKRCGPGKVTEKHKHTGQTGSWTYMAPEVAKGWAYDSSIDVYSFGVLLWELLTLETAFDGYDKEDVQRCVVRGDERPLLTPRLTQDWPLHLPSLLRSCWSPFPSHRPAFSTIVTKLQDMKDELEHERQLQEEQLRSKQQITKSRLGIAVLVAVVFLVGLVLWKLFARFHTQIAAKTGL